MSPAPFAMTTAPGRGGGGREGAGTEGLAHARVWEVRQGRNSGRQARQRRGREGAQQKGRGARCTAGGWCRRAWPVHVHPQLAVHGCCTAGERGARPTRPLLSGLVFPAARPRKQACISERFGWGPAVGSSPSCMVRPMRAVLKSLRICRGGGAAEQIPGICGILGFFSEASMREPAPACRPPTLQPLLAAPPTTAGSR